MHVLVLFGNGGGGGDCCFSVLLHDYVNVRVCNLHLLKLFEVLKKCRKKFICLVRIRNAFYMSYKAKSQGILRLNSWESSFIIFAPWYVSSSCQNRFNCCNLHNLIYFYLIIES